MHKGSTDRRALSVRLPTAPCSSVRTHVWRSDTDALCRSPFHGLCPPRSVVGVRVTQTFPFEAGASAGFQDAQRFFCLTVVRGAHADVL